MPSGSLSPGDDTMSMTFFRSAIGLLLVMGMIPFSQAADHPVPDPAGGVTAWGKPVKGLQAGLRCPKDQQIIGPDKEEVTLEIIVRNVSDEPIAFKYLNGVRYTGKIKHTTVEVGGIYSGNGHAFTANIHPGREMLLGRVSLGHAQPKASPAASSLCTELRPGKYQVGSDRVGMPLRDEKKDLRLGTGYLDIEVRDRK